MKQVDEIIYDAIVADETLVSLTEGRIVSTCFEVPPDAEDDTGVPYIIVIDAGFQNNQATKDEVWEADEDTVQVNIEIAAESPKAVKSLVKQVRQAIENHIVSLSNFGEDTPQLERLSSEGIAWDWTKPCYYQTLNFISITTKNTD